MSKLKPFLQIVQIKRRLKTRYQRISKTDETQERRLVNKSHRRWQICQKETDNQVCHRSATPRDFILGGSLEHSALAHSRSWPLQLESSSTRVGDLGM